MKRKNSRSIDGFKGLCEAVVNGARKLYSLVNNDPSASKGNLDTDDAGNLLVTFAGVRGIASALGYAVGSSTVALGNDVVNVASVQTVCNRMLAGLAYDDTSKRAGRKSEAMDFARTMLADVL